MMVRLAAPALFLLTAGPALAITPRSRAESMAYRSAEVIGAAAAWIAGTG